MTNQIQNPKPETKLRGRFSRLRSFDHLVIDSSFGFRISDFRPRGSVRHSGFEFRASRPAFTLVELMISLAMVLILILGINFVFRSATDAIGAGQALNGINADAQSAQPVLFDDLRNVSKLPPCFIISSQLVTQFLNTDDAKTSSDPTVIVTDNNGGYVMIGAVKPTYMSTAPTQFMSPALLNSRNHRADLLKFFAHANYHRRSGPDGTYYASDSSDDAFIELGHAALPTNDLTAFYGPSSLPASGSGYTPYTDQTTPAVLVPGIPRLGAFASDWVLTRRVTLLKDPNSIPPSPTTPPNLASNPTDPYYTTGNGTPLQYAPYGTAPTAFTVNMAPLSYGTPNNNPADNPGGTNPPQNLFQSSRYDLAGITPDAFDRVIANAILSWQNGGAYGGASLWWNPLVYSLQMSQGGPAAPQTFPDFAPYTTSQTNLYFFNSPFTYTGLPAPTAATDPGVWYNRPQCNPTVQTPVTAASLAEMAPYFLQHCSQFIVEYAGDYMQQNNTPGNSYGAMTGLGPDGQIDFYVDSSGNKHIRWYGMPRSSTGVPHPSDSTGKTLVLIRGFDGTKIAAGGTEDPTAAGATPNMAPLNFFTDVIPLRDYYSMFRDVGGAEFISNPPWEVDVNFDPCLDYGAYAAPIPTPANNGFATGGDSNGNSFNNPANPPRYVAAWHDDMPAMVRIPIKVDDPNNKVKDGPWYEYVFRLK
jgi:prepilin-type N-terminal cleavage/methylation domain-containing protein